MLSFKNKIIYLKEQLDIINDNYTDSFKTDIFFFFDDFETSNSGLFHFKYEYAFTDKFSAGLSIGHAKIRGSWKASNSNDEFWDLSFSDPNAGNYTLSSSSIVARFNWNMLKTEKIDVYFGTGAGLRFESYSENVVESEIYGAENIKMLVPLSFEASFGLRYFITPNFGFYSEVGLAKSFFQGGVVLGF